jgi:hypothetical protein
LHQDEAIRSYQVSIGGEDTTDPESSVRPRNMAQGFINVKEDADVRRTVDRVDQGGNDLYRRTSRSRSCRTALRRAVWRPSSPAARRKGWPRPRTS